MIFPASPPRVPQYSWRIQESIQKMSFPLFRRSQLSPLPGSSSLQNESEEFGAFNGCPLPVFSIWAWAGEAGEGYSPTLNKEAVPLASANAYEKLGVEFGEWLMSKKDGIQSQ